MKTFTTEGRCIPSIHYMVRMADNIQKMQSMVKAGKYFIISRPRQYGKTTTLFALEQALSGEYTVVRMSLTSLDESAYEARESFARSFCQRLLRLKKQGSDIPEEIGTGMAAIANGTATANLQSLSALLEDWCLVSPRPVVLILDEVDRAEGSDVFRDFLGKLRDSYIERDPEHMQSAFQSVILAGVTDVEHLKGGIRPQDQSRGTGSPWNIASNLDIPMELPSPGIMEMLREYKTDHHIRMNVKTVTESIMRWTSGYPYLVSRICEILDTMMVPDRFPSLSKAWTAAGVDEAASMIITKESSLLSSLMGKVNNLPELAQNLSDFLYKGKYINYSMDNEQQKQFLLYGFARVSNGYLVIHNEIFRVRLTRKFDDDFHQRDMRGHAVWEAGASDKRKFVDTNGDLDVYRLLERFTQVFTKVRYSSLLPDEEAQEKAFIEEAGRRQFLLYLTPIINGTGTYTIEEQTLDKRRMDVVIHYRGKRYVIELKIWRGVKYNSDGEQQLKGYLDYFGLNVGYMLTFSFTRNKQVGMHSHTVDGRLLHEAVV